MLIYHFFLPFYGAVALEIINYHPFLPFSL